MGIQAGITPQKPSPIAYNQPQPRNWNGVQIQIVDDGMGETGTTMTTYQRTDLVEGGVGEANALARVDVRGKRSKNWTMNWTRSFAPAPPPDPDIITLRISLDVRYTGFQSLCIFIVPYSNCIITTLRFGQLLFWANLNSIFIFVLPHRSVRSLKIRRERSRLTSALFSFRNPCL